MCWRKSGKTVHIVLEMFHRHHVLDLAAAKACPKLQRAHVQSACEWCGISTDKEPSRFFMWLLLFKLVLFCQSADTSVENNWAWRVLVHVCSEKWHSFARGTVLTKDEHAQTHAHTHTRTHTRWLLYKRLSLLWNKWLILWILLPRLLPLNDLLCVRVRARARLRLKYLMRAGSRIKVIAVETGERLQKSGPEGQRY